MITSLKELLIEARKEQKAIAAFNVPNLAMIRAAIQAAEAQNVPVILQHAESHDSIIPLEEIGPIMVDYAKRSKVPVVVHLDHGKKLETIVKAIDLGFTSVMIDASSESFEENVRLTKEVIQLAHAKEISVEAELGHVYTSSLGGGEGRKPDDELIGIEKDFYTDPELAKKFVNKTHVDCLAIAFGTVHGIYLKKPQLDLPRIKQIYEKVQVPLVMHGGSGVSESEYQIAINNGIAKINYYTYANKLGADSIRQIVDSDCEETLFLEYYFNEITQSLKNSYAEVIECFDNSSLEVKYKDKTKNYRFS